MSPRTLAAQVYDPKASLRVVLAERSCRICPRPAGGCHHLVAKGAPHFGDDVEANLIPLCGSGTTGCHGKIEAHDREACQRLAERLTAANVLYVMDLLGDVAGQAFIERRYGVVD